MFGATLLAQAIKTIQGSGRAMRLGKDFKICAKEIQKFQSSGQEPAKYFRILSENFNLFPGIETYQWVTGEWKGKKSTMAAVGPYSFPFRPREADAAAFRRTPRASFILRRINLP
jgi:hypothetical protein